MTEQLTDEVNYVTTITVSRWSTTQLFEGVDDPNRPHRFRERLVANRMEFRVYSDTDDVFIYFPAVNPRQNGHWLRFTEDGLLQLIVLAAGAAASNGFSSCLGYLGDWWHKSAKKDEPHDARQIIGYLERVIETVDYGPLHRRSDVCGPEYDEC